MQAPMSTKFRKFLSNPKNASKLTEKVLLNEKSKEGFQVELGGKTVTVKQIGLSGK